MHVRFLNNFVITIVTTVLNDQGRMVAQERKVPVRMGDNHPVSQYEVHSETVDLHFSKKTPLEGVARRIPIAYCELHDPKKTRQLRQQAEAEAIATGKKGCGGCGNRRKKG